MNSTVKIQQRGTVTLPKKIRDMFDLKEGSFLNIKKKGNQIILEPQRDEELHKEIMESVVEALEDIKNGNTITFSSIEELHKKAGIVD